MAIAEAPFKIKGTIDDLNFFLDQGNKNRIRKKAESTMTSQKYWNEPQYHAVRMQGQEMGHCSRTSQIFRRITLAFNKNAKDGSYVGRANAVFLHMVKEDHKNAYGSRLVTEGIKSKYGQKFLLGFESNKLRPLSLVLPSKKWTLKKHCFKYLNGNVATDLDWPEDAPHVTFNLAVANWNIAAKHFTTHYGEPQFLPKTNNLENITITVTPPTEEDLHLTFLFIGFSRQQGSKHVPLHRKFNTATLIHYHYFPQHPDEEYPSSEATAPESIPPPFSFT